MPPPVEHQSEKVSTWLVIPYFDGDLGRPEIERPLPSGKGVSYACPSIIVNGQRGGTAFQRGTPLSIEIEVANWGAGTLPAAGLVRLWWCDATLAFAKAKQFAQAPVQVPPTGEPVRVGTFRVTIPLEASPHVCLLAHVSAPEDGASGAPNPVEDRRWAQLNLLEVSAAADGTVVLPLVLGNPLPFTARSSLTLSPMPREDANLLAAMRGADIHSGLEARVDTDDVQELELPPESVRDVALTVRPASLSRNGPAQGYVLTQRLSRAGESEDTILTGTIGVLIGAA